ncbi:MULTISPECIES: enoyl-CoA hydratase/isomerase family protein [Streptomyces]|uniref:enoyl-CoA hydratase/isomerase family protein n=1 Tax=Streptomyces TaxID=1883 RepID=UPI002259C826|nr:MULTISPECIES: enoyl-CoA hydratase/isomerase family protein [Streptomyces]MCX5059095.1 enoyl-CoA hydratase/isomerase family protein [Streptomyces sp. NBC_00452]
MIRVEDLAAGAAQAELLGADGTVEDPLVVVDLDQPAADETVLRRAVRRAAECDRLLVGLTRTTDGTRHLVPPLLDALDLTLVPVDSADRRLVAVDDPEATARTLVRAAADSPQAAVILGRLLRTGPRLTVGQALDAESLAYSTLLAGRRFARWQAARAPRRPPPPAPADPVLVCRDGDVLRVTLNRPERHNAYGRELRDALVAALDLALLDDTLTEVVLSGNGPSFCSGGDLGEFGVARDLDTAHLIRTRAGAALPLHKLRDRVTVRLHGNCIGAGIELPAFASRVVADPGAVFRLPELGMGLIPGAGGTVSVPRRIGRWRTLHLVLTGCPLTAERALDWGLVDELSPSGPTGA